MRPVSSLARSTRFEAGNVRLISVSTYQCKLMGEEVTKYRHVFQMSDGRKLFYTGTKQIGCYQFPYDIRATVKRQEPEYGGTRIMRPVLTPIVPQRPLI